MVAGAQSAATCNVAIDIETTSGTAGTVPGAYVIMGGDIKPVNTKESKPRQVAGQPFPTLPYKGVETFSLPMPMLPVIEDASSPTVLRNGLGELMLSLWGAETPAQLGSSAAYAHTYTWEDLIKTFTTWLHFSERDMKARMCAVDSLDVGVKSDGELTLDFDVKGADLADTTDYGSASYIDLGTAKQITGLGAKLEFGHPQANVREAWEDLTLSFKRNLDFGAPGKAGQHPAGSGSPQIVTSTTSEARLAFTIRDADGVEFDRWRVGGNTAPASVDRHTDVITAIDARLSLYGSEIAAEENSEADYLNAGTTTLALTSSSYTGGSSVLIGEIEMDPYTFTTADGTNKDLSFHSKSASDVTITITTGVGTLSVSVANHDITVEMASGGSTASAVLAAILAKAEAAALIDANLAFGSTGAGTMENLSKTDINVDGFRYRYTTGAGWGSWSGWEMVTESAQDGPSGFKFTFSDDDKTADGDKFYFSSHYMYMLRFNLPDLIIEKAEPDYSGGIRKLKIEAYHSSASTANRPTMVLNDTKTTAYS